MRLNAFALGLMLFAGPTFAATSFPDCVVQNVAAARADVRCNFDDLRSQLPQADQACRGILIEAFTASADRANLMTQVSAWKEQADQRVSELLTAEIKACGFQGEAVVHNGGRQLSLTIVKIK